MKVAIATPCHRDTSVVYTQSLAGVLLHTMKVRPDLDLGCFFSRGALILRGRMSLVGEAQKWGADYILWLDADQDFPPHTLIRLLDHGKDLIGCNIARRTDPTGPTAFAIDGQPLWTTEEKAVGEIEEVAAVGLGVCLMSMKAVAAVGMPTFNSGINAAGQIVGEDGYFMAKAREAGFSVWCDHGLSWEVGHAAEAVLTCRDTIADKARWIEAQKPT